MHELLIPWPDVRLYARLRGEVDPYHAENTSLFRGEEAFADDVTGWKRWSKPSPEPRLDGGFEAVLLDSIGKNAPQIHGLARELARRIGAAFERAPVLVAVLRAGVPICALLCPLLKAHFGEDVPICAMSLFYGLGWDEAALEQIVADFPGREILFVDGWTSGGGVAKQLNESLALWLARGKPDFSRGRGVQFAVLCDPRGKATLSAVQADCFVPSAAFTAPETLGFSRGFAFEDESLFGVYSFPVQLQKPAWIGAWMNVLNAPVAPLPRDEVSQMLAVPPGFRADVNEVTRALINRDPVEIQLLCSEDNARETLAPLLYLARLRGIPVLFGCDELRAWNTSALARMR